MTFLLFTIYITWYEASSRNSRNLFHIDRQTTEIQQTKHFLILVFSVSTVLRQQVHTEPGSPVPHGPDGPDEPGVAGGFWVMVHCGKKEDDDLKERSFGEYGSVTAISMMNGPVPVTHLTPGPVDTRRWKTMPMNPTSLSANFVFFSSYTSVHELWRSGGCEQLRWH